MGLSPKKCLDGDRVNREKGFTLIELILIMVLMSIIGITASPLFNQSSAFQERFFIDELMNMLRFANITATATGCDIVIKEVDKQKLGLFMRQNCKQDDYTRAVLSPFILDGQTTYLVNVPKALSVSSFPIYIDSNGQVTDSSQHWQKVINVSINQHRLLIDGTSGFVYEKF